MEGSGAKTNLLPECISYLFCLYENPVHPTCYSIQTICSSSPNAEINYNVLNK